MKRFPGFTLLEMLVALTLLAFIVVAGQQAIALAGRAAVPRGDGGHSFLVRHQIADWIEAALPVRSGRREQSPMLFSGESAELRFVTSLPYRFGIAGPHIVSLGIDPERGKGLMLKWQPLRPPDEVQVGQRLLLEEVQGVRFRYWGGQREPNWLSIWRPRDRLPTLIEITFTGGVAEGWPPLVVTLRNAVR